MTDKDFLEMNISSDLAEKWKTIMNGLCAFLALKIPKRLSLSCYTDSIILNGQNEYWEVSASIINMKWIEVVVEENGQIMMTARYTGSNEATVIVTVCNFIFSSNEQ